MKKLFLIISSLFLTSCSILSFSAATKDAGLLSIKLNNSKVSLSLSEKQSFNDSKQTLNVKSTYQFIENTYTSLPAKEVLDDEATPFDYGLYKRENDESVMTFFKYTFYIKNTGDVIADYVMDIGLKENKTTDGTGRMITDTLRVMIFENDINNDSKESIHTTAIYAKEAAEYNIDKNGNRTRREFVSTYPYLNEEDDDHPLADSFIDTNTIAKYTRRQFNKDQIVRYTFVAWLEGEDPQSSFDAEVPQNSTMQFSINIDSYASE